MKAKDSMNIKSRTISSNLNLQEWREAIHQEPRKYIGSNSKLKKSGIYQWSIPAYRAAVWNSADRFNEKFKTCPFAGECAKFCYACQGCFNFGLSMIAHTRCLQAYLNHPKHTAEKIIAEIKSKRKLKAFRIHDSGDFFNVTYAKWWFDICRELPDIQFYAYTKCVGWMKNTMLGAYVPDNLTLIYSYGGKEDHLIDPNHDRHSRVFRTHAAMKAAGYHDTTKTDDAAADPSIKKIGLVYHGTMGVDKAMGEEA